jgi:hypothetical protein
MDLNFSPRLKLYPMNNLKVTGTTSEMESWDLDSILNDTMDSSKERLIQYEWDNKIASNGMTYLEIEQFNNTYNNFR